jgi:hypothetical protein
MPFLRLVFSVFLCLIISQQLLAQSGVISGKVLNSLSNEPIPFATVLIQGLNKGTLSDLDGNYEFKELSPGLYNVEFSSIGFKKAVAFELEVSNSRVTVYNAKLEELALEIGEAEVVGTAFSNREEAPLSVRKIGVNEVKRNPGGNRDISRAIQSLPGVASIPSFRNDIIIRGGAPNENRFYIDGIEIPNINHFATQGASGGPVGLINVDFIEDVEFYSGAFPANRGNALSSVLEFGFKEGRKDRYSANMVVGSSDLGLTVEGPTGDKSSIIMSARRSYLQYLFAALNLPFLPIYNDFQFKWKSKINERNEITVLGLGAIDDFELNSAIANDPEAEDYLDNRYLLDFLAVNSQWNYSTGVKWDHYRDKSKWVFVLSRNMLNNEAFKYLNNDESKPRLIDYVSQEMENKFRIENKTFFGNGWKLNSGVNYEYARYNNNSRFGQYNYSLDTIVNLFYSSNLDLHKFGLFSQASKTFLGERLVLSAGIRLDGNTYSNEMSNVINQFSPRLSARYSITPELSFNFNTGIYYQLPAYTILGYKENAELVNKDNGLKYKRNKQLVAGFEYLVDKRNSVITVEGFYKWYDQYPFSIDKGISLANLGADFGVIGNEAVTSTSVGRAYGAEFLLQQKLYAGFYGILAYTYVRSEFSDVNGEYIPSSWDSRHLISVTGGKKFKRNWELGMRFRLSGGLPYTPYDIDASMAIPVWEINRSGLPDYSRLNSERIPAFHQLDIRVDKKWYFSKWTFNLFLDIQNIYNQVTPLQDLLDVERDAAGNPIVSAQNPGSYTPAFRKNTNGTLLPSIGIIIEL